MKKLILYLGLLCALFSVPQVAYAADPVLYIRGQMNGWGASDSWQFQHEEGTSIYTLTVPNNDWKASHTFKVGAGGDSNWDSYGFSSAHEDESIPLNGSWVLWHDTASKDMKVAQDVPAGTKITFDSSKPELTVGELQWQLSYRINGSDYTMPFENVSGDDYIITGFDKFKGLISSNDNLNNSFVVKYGSTEYGHNSDWINGDTKTSMTLYSGNRSKFNFQGTNGSSCSYDVKWNASSHVIEFVAKVAKTDLYIRGGMNGWNAENSWKFDYDEATGLYTLTVPNDQWTASTEFKIGDNVWGSANTYGNRAGIAPNSPIILLGADGSGNNTTMAEDVPQGAKVTYNATTHAFRVDYDFKPAALYKVTRMGGDAFICDHTPLTKNGDKFTGDMPAIAGTSGRITFFTKDGESLSGRGIRFIPANVTETQNATFTDELKTYNQEGQAYWLLGNGKWSYEIDFSGDTPTITFTKDEDYVEGPENLFFRFNTSGNPAPDNASWIYSNTTTKDGNKFKGAISLVKEYGGDICLATVSAAGWSGTYNYGPATNTTVDPDSPDTSYPMALGNTASWHLTKGIWSFECDFTNPKNPTVKFTRLFDEPSAANHDQLHEMNLCSATKVYIVGNATPGGWNFNTESRMVHVAGNMYTYTVPESNGTYEGWKSSAAFKIVDGGTWDDPQWGCVKNIAANTTEYTKLSDAAGEEDYKNASTNRDLPAGTKVHYNMDDHSIRIEYAEDIPGPEVDAADKWTIGGSVSQPEIYVVGNYLNDNKANPGYRMTPINADTYTLERFVIQEGTEFSLIQYQGADNAPYKVGPNSAVTTTGIDASDANKTEFEFNMATGTDNKIKWNNGVAMISLTYYRNGTTPRLVLTTHPEVPNQANFTAAGQVHGVPYVAFVGYRLSQDPGNTTTYNDGKNNTKSGWQDGWQAYSAGHKRQIMGETVPGIGSEGQAIPNTIWPPRNRIDFQNKAQGNYFDGTPDDGNERNWTTDAITFEVNPDCMSKYIESKEEAETLLKQQGVTIDDPALPEGLTLTSTMIPAKGYWTRYDTNNVTMSGIYKLWSGWGGQFNDGNADWYHHHNWGVGALDKTASVEIHPNFVYYSRDELNDKMDADDNFVTDDKGNHLRDSGGNFDFSKSDKYFKQFSFYSVRYADKRGDIRYRYFLVARLAAEDPRIAATRGAKPDDLEAEYSIQQQIASAEVESKLIKTCKVYLSQPDGTSFDTEAADKPARLLVDNSWASGISIKDFNAQAEADRTIKAEGLPAGDYRFKVVVTYEGDDNEYDATSNVLTVFPQVASYLTLEQVMTDKGQYSFALRAKGSAPSQFTDEQKKAIQTYKLTVNSQTGRPFPEGARLVVKYKTGDVPTEIGTLSSPQTITVETGEEYGYDMPEVIMENARVGKTYRFTIQSQGEGINDPGYTARARVYGPHATMTLIAGVANSAGVQNAEDIKYLNGMSLRAHANWVRLAGEITPPNAEPESMARYNVKYRLRHIHAANDSVEVMTLSREAVEANNGNITIDFLPYKASADGTPVENKYKFAITTLYEEKNVPDLDEHPEGWTLEAVKSETAEAALDVDTFTAPRVDSSSLDDEVVLVKNYSERFHGLHNYWYDAYVGLEIENLPFSANNSEVEGCLVGALAEIATSEGTKQVAPIEAGGNYAYGNLLTTSNLPEGAWWHSPLPEGTTGHEHYYGNSNTGKFYATNSSDSRNQWFCTVDHSSEASAKGYGTISDREANNLGMTGAVGNQSEDSWIKNGKIYRKVHHVHHEARFFGSADSYQDHSTWCFPQSEYTPIEANIYYAYNMLASDHATVTSPTPEARTAMRAPALPAEAVYTTVLSGKTEKIGLEGATVYDGVTTGIDNVIDNDSDEPVEYYNLQGVKVENPAAGIYIFRQGSRTGKILIK